MNCQPASSDCYCDNLPHPTDLSITLPVDVGFKGTSSSRPKPTGTPSGFKHFVSPTVVQVSVTTYNNEDYKTLF